VPAPLRWIIARCLAKEPAGRYQATRDLARELKGLNDHLSELSAVLPEAAPPRWRRALVGAAIALVALGAGVLLWSHYAVEGRARPEPQFRRLTLQRGSVYRALFAPGSNAILYTAAFGGEPPRTFLTLPDSYGADRALESGLQIPLNFSQDGSQVLTLEGTFRPTISVRGNLAWWPTLGGQPRRLVDDAGWGDWAPRGRFLAVVRDTGQERVLEVRNADGQPLRTVYRTAGAISFVRISPDEKQIAFIQHPTLFGSSGAVRVVSVDGSGSRALTRSFRDCFGLDWHRDTGRIWFTTAASDFANGALWSVGLTGPPRLHYVFPERFVLNNVDPAGDRCLMISSHDRATLTVRRGGGEVRDLSWFGWTMIEDLSPDGQSALFSDEGRTEASSGSWIRPLAGGAATPVGEFDSGRFSPDGQWIVGLTSAEDRPPQLMLIPVGPGKSRELTATAATHATPSFVNGHTLLFLRSEGGASEVWTMETDGSAARSLGGAGCSNPAARPDGSAYLCLGGDRDGTIFVYPMRQDPGRVLISLAAGQRIQYARWNGSGDRIFVVTSDRRFLTLDASNGTLLREETLPVSAEGGANGLYTAAFNADATIQLYSTARFASDLYLVSNIR
jgi:Tol biopolymer transport system component